MVLGVVRGEESLAEAAGVLDGTKALGELGSVFQGFEVTFENGLSLETWGRL
jgi:hypothetical protein